MASNREAPTGREEPPPSKKRVALRQISKDDDPDSEEEDGAAMGGTFRRASEEVLAERRIVKVRRTPAPSSTPNPFAAIRLVPPTIPQQESPVPPPVTPSNSTTSVPKLAVGSGVDTPAASVEAAVSEDRLKREDLAAGQIAEQKSIGKVESPKQEDNSVASQLENEDVAGDAGANAEDVAEVKPVPSSVDVHDKSAVNGDEHKARGGELVGPSGTSSETFEQLSSAKNAFAGSFATGFSSTSSVVNSSSSASAQVSTGFSFGQPFKFGDQGFSFGSGQAQSPFGTNTGSQLPFSSVSSVFGKSNGGSTPFFGSLTPSTTLPAAGHSKPAVVSLQEVHVETGEEKEKAIFAADAALFEFLDGGWKERGKGELKLNVSEEKDKRPRLVMRSKGNYRLLLNANLFPDMKLSKMDNRGISFVCANSAAEGKTGLTTYAVKLKDAIVASEFTTTVEAHKGNLTSEPRTPESSPKATERPSKVVEPSHVEA